MASQYDAQINEIEALIEELEGYLPQLRAIGNDELAEESEQRIENLRFYLAGLKNLRFNELES